MVLRQADVQVQVEKFYCNLLFPHQDFTNRNELSYETIVVKVHQKIRNGWKYICHLTLYCGKKIKRFFDGTL
jgi:hypothetical protein